MRLLVSIIVGIWALGASAQVIGPGVIAEAGPIQEYVVTERGNAGENTLRWALEEANADGVYSKVTFNVDGPIEVTTLLPEITERVLIDGTSNSPCKHDEKYVIVDVNYLSKGLVIRSDYCTVRGVELRNFTSYGMGVHGQNNNLEKNALYCENPGSYEAAIVLHPYSPTEEEDVVLNWVADNIIGSGFDHVMMESSFEYGILVGVENGESSLGKVNSNIIGTPKHPNIIRRSETAVFLNNVVAGDGSYPLAVKRNRISGNRYELAAAAKKIDVNQNLVVARQYNANDYQPYRTRPLNVVASPGVITGESEPGDLIEVYKEETVEDGTVHTYFLGETTANASGKWALYSLVWTMKGYEIKEGDILLATGRDDSGNSTEFSIATEACLMPNSAFVFDNCSGKEVAFNLDVSIISSAPSADPSVVDYNWDFGDGESSTEQNPVHTFPTIGNDYTVTLTAANGVCVSTKSRVVEVRKALIPDFAITSGSCLTTAVSFSDNTENLSEFEGLSWEWDFGDGTTGTGEDVSHPYTSPGEYEVVMTVSSTNPICEKSISKKIQITEPFTAELEISHISCEGNEDGWIKTRVSGGTPPYTYEWDAPLTVTTAGVADLSPGNYGVTIKDQSGCEEHLTTTLIQESSDINLTILTDKVNLCEGEYTTINAGPGMPAEVFWNTGDIGPQLTVRNRGEYFLTARDANGCEVESNHIKVFEVELTGDIEGGTEQELCQGEEAVLFAVQRNASKYTWSSPLWTEPRTGRSVRVSELGTYTVTVEREGADYHCTASSSTILVEGDDCGGLNLCDFEPTLIEVEIVDECESQLRTVAKHNAKEKFDDYIRQTKEQFKKEYIEECLSKVSESMDLTYVEGQYQYTLFYYDQAGNLVRTVPPKGVNRLEDATEIKAVATARKEGNDKKIAHDFATTYQYNSRNQLVAENAPDHNLIKDDTRFSHKMFYDDAGRIIISQDARKSHIDPEGSFAGFYTYTDYDVNGRVNEVGVIKAIAAPETLYSSEGRLNTQDSYKIWLQVGDKTEVVKTLYDHSAEELIDPRMTQRNLRNRVSAVRYYEDGENLSNATYFSYDIHGNVDAVMQYLGEIPGGATKHKLTEYEYDLISGNVTKVHYQAGEIDQYHFKYAYDSDNKITDAWSSRDGMEWTREASYEYYRHGVLARVELGDQKVQAMDYAYTLQGWIKGINSSTATSQSDIGNDGLASATNPHSAIPQDEMGMTLGYFGNDYQPIKSPTASMEASLSGAVGEGALADAGRSLYNGNINHMVTSLTSIRDYEPKADTTHGVSYTYDQLNRITSSTHHKASNLQTANSWTDAVATNHFSTGYEYDQNGNITKLYRNDSAGVRMDSLIYTYESIDGGRKSNRLLNVEEKATDAALDYHDFKGSSDYTYDANGNMTSDSGEEIDTILWNNMGKISEIIRTEISTQPDLEFTYDGMGHRVSKTVYPKHPTGERLPQLHWKKTIYVRDASGALMSLYEVSYEEGLTENTFVESVKQIEVPINSGKRIGNHHMAEGGNLVSQFIFNSSDYDEDSAFVKGATIGTNIPLPSQRSYYKGVRQYELTNHLGNVLATVSDRLEVDEDEEGNVSYSADVTSLNDYYPFGMVQPGRNYQSGDYRFGFNGMEKDDEFKVKGMGNSLDFGARIYDARLGRFLSLDPARSEFPHTSPYAFAENDVVRSIDIGGMAKFVVIQVDVNDPSSKRTVDPIRQLQKSQIQKKGSSDIEISPLASKLSVTGLIRRTVRNATRNGDKVRFMAIIAHGKPGRILRNNRTKINIEKKNRGLRSLSHLQNDFSAGAVTFLGTCGCGNSVPLPNGEWKSLSQEMADRTKTLVVSVSTGKLDLLADSQGNVLGDGMAFVPEEEGATFVVSVPGQEERLTLDQVGLGGAIKSAIIDGKRVDYLDLGELSKLSNNRAKFFEGLNKLGKFVEKALD